MGTQRGTTSTAPEGSAAPGIGPELVRVNGRAAREVSALERGLHYGDGLFETIACLGGQPRLLELHLKRLHSGCGRLGLSFTDEATLAREVQELAAGCSRAIVKVLLTRGVALNRGYAPTGRELPTRVTLRYAWPEDDPAAARDGVRVRLALQRLGENPALAGLKHCNRLEQILARREWSDPAIAESLMFSSSGALISGTMSNVFLVCDSLLLTPRVDRCGVAGVMRTAVLATARAAGIRAEERVLGHEDLVRASEIFLTSALTGIRPVRELEGTPRVPGSVTRHLQTQLAASLGADADASRGERG
jgi:4-amino-4-deoxychorismate lyase